MTEETLNQIEDLISQGKALAESVSMAAVGPDHRAGQMSSQSLQTLGFMIFEILIQISALLGIPGLTS